MSTIGLVLYSTVVLLSVVSVATLVHRDKSSTAGTGQSPGLVLSTNDAPFTAPGKVVWFSDVRRDLYQVGGGPIAVYMPMTASAIINGKRAEVEFGLRSDGAVVWRAVK